MLRDGKPEHLIFGALAQVGGKKQLIDIRSNCPIDPCLTSNPAKDHFSCYHLLTFPSGPYLMTLNASPECDIAGVMWQGC